MFEKGFCKLFNGLMLKGSPIVKEVFCISFPTPAVLRTILDTMTGNTLIFTHHPIDMITGGKGFIAIDLALLEKLKKRNVSIYSVHAPLDIHQQLGTNSAIVEALSMKVVKSFAPYPKAPNYAGRIGTIKPISFERFTGVLKDLFGISKLDIGGTEIAEVRKIAVVAGGADEVQLMEEAQNEGCEVFLTGEWYTRVTPTDKEGIEWAKRNNKECIKFSRETTMSLIAVSHAASEFLVMRTQMKKWLEDFGLRVTAVPQKDWWR